MDRARRRRRRLASLCVLLFVVLAAGGLVVVQLDRVQRQVTDDRTVLAQAGTVRAAVEEELYRTVNLGVALRSYVVAHPGLEDEDHIRVMLADLYDQGEHVRNFGLAPDDVIAHVHPVEGNEAVVGVDYRDLPDQYPAVEQARRTRSSVLAGPVELVQGGTGLINRTPVFLPDGTYWGVVSLVLDVDSLLEEVHRRTDQVPIAWALRTVADEGEAPVMIDGDPDLFRPGVVTSTFAVPDGTWEVAAVPEGGTGRDWRTVGLALAVLVVSGLLAGLGYRVVADRWTVLELSLHDPLTGLPNRRLLDERFELVVAQARRAGRPFSLVYVDLDEFKPVNDEYGHRVGDEVLAHIAGRLAERVRTADTMARVGGDEFVALLPETDALGARALAEDLEATAAEPVEWSGHRVTVGASTGIATFPADGDDFDDLVRIADDRMYAAKRQRARN